MDALDYGRTICVLGDRLLSGSEYIVNEGRRFANKNIFWSKKMNGKINTIKWLQYENIRKLYGQNDAIKNDI